MMKIKELMSIHSRSVRALTRALTAILFFSVVFSPQARAASVFMWVTSGNTIIALDGTGATIANGTTTLNGQNPFSLATDGTHLYVGDATNHTLKQYTYDTNGALTASKTYTFTADTISPQEIALDSSGNLYTLSFGGEVTRFSPASATGTHLNTVVGARGLAVDSGNNTAYVTTSADGGATVVDFSIAGVDSTVNTLFTGGAYPAGQLRGIAVNGSTNAAHPTLYFADSSWSATSVGTLMRITGAGSTNIETTVASGLNGPNQIALTTAAGIVNKVYVAEYSGQDVVSVDRAGRATRFNQTAFSSPVTGIALNPGFANNDDPLSADALSQTPPATFFDLLPFDSINTPEPGTYVMTLSSLAGLALGMVADKKSRKGKQAARS